MPDYTCAHCHQDSSHQGHFFSVNFHVEHGYAKREEFCDVMARPNGDLGFLCPPHPRVSEACGTRAQDEGEE